MMSDYNPFSQPKRITTGTYSITPQQREDIRRSIAYYNGDYAPKKGDRIVPKEYLDVLRKKAGL
jgi:hypothetical protein